jgi:hypothetical protein
MNIHILATYKASRLQKTKYGNLFLVNKFKSYDNCTPQHIYITNDEEIKPNDWYENNGVIFKADTLFDEGNNPNNSNPRVTDFNKKIILTTDPQLIEDGVQEIDKTFLEWFVKNPSCESVDVKDFPTTEKYNSKGEYIHNSNWIYKIIIPKEEPKQEWNPTQGEEVWMKVFSNWSKGTYIGYDVVKQTHIVREEEKGGGHLCSSIEVLPYYAMPNEPQQETLEQSYQRGYERGLNALIPLIENLNKEITELKRNLYIR